jgi:hypothetical protein
MSLPPEAFDLVVIGGRYRRQCPGDGVGTGRQSRLGAGEIVSLPGPCEG